jgi:hypothetical protein
MKTTLAVLSFLVLSFSTLTTTRAATILKLDLVPSGHDIQLDGGLLSIIDDADSSTVGGRNTNITFEGPLDQFADIINERASISLHGVVLHGIPTVLSGIVVQPTVGGTVSIWDDLNGLLLEADLNIGSIIGPLGSTATGAFTNLNLGTITGGSLASHFIPESYSIAFAFTNVNDGVGFSVTANDLNDFLASSTADIDAIPVPEPPTGVLLAACITLGLLASRFSRKET